MLSTCCSLAERRLEKARREFFTNKETILTAKSDLESIFHKIRGFKQILAQKYFDVYTNQGYFFLKSFIIFFFS